MVSSPDSRLLNLSADPPTRQMRGSSTASAPILVATDDASLTDTLDGILENEDVYSTASKDIASIDREVDQLLPRALLLDSRFMKDTTPVVCRHLRKTKSANELPIIVITTPEDVQSRVQALESGADDCITAPGDLREVAARILAKVRNEGPQQRGYLRAGPIEIDLDRWTARASGKEITLTKKEFLLLETLIESRGRTLSREYLLRNVWSLSESIETRTIDVHIARLRRKLGPAGRYILTVRNVGFRLDLVPDWITGRPPSRPN